MFRADEALTVHGKRCTLRDLALRLIVDTNSIDPEELFGAMTVVRGHSEQGAFLVPVELRSLGNEDKTWAEVSAELDQLCVWSEEAYRQR